MNALKFAQVKELVKPLPGLYEIRTADGLPIKVGIAKNLKKRLSAHGKSRQNCLKLKIKEDGYTLGNVESRQSILAKHLYFDSTLTEEYDLRTEIGRALFLENECLIELEYTCTRDEARELERMKEASGKYRYLGRVRQR